MLKKFPGQLPLYLLAFCLLGVTSCGSDDNSSSSSSPQEETSQQEQEDNSPQDNEGSYQVNLNALNTSLGHSTSGMISIKIMGDDVLANASVINSPAGVKHLQSVHLGKSCPEASSDTNGDGYIDAVEAGLRSGLILIPLDSDLDTQLDGFTYGPMANASGAYVYRRTTTLTNLLADLRAPDPDSFDTIGKLPADQELNLAGRVVMIYGVAGASRLPNTVSAVNGRSRQESLPIACGILQRLASDI